MNTSPAKCCCAFLVAWLLAVPCWSQPAPEKSAEEIRTGLSRLETRVGKLKQGRNDERPVADIEVCAKAADWILRHEEFYRPDYLQWTLDALKLGEQRAAEFAQGKSPWLARPGSSVRGYYSQVDGSVQPYAVTLPAGIDPQSGHRWPLHVVLHGRNNTLNEVSFIHQHEGKAAPEGQNWIQLDVFGRTNNAYRWSGETDVFEAIAAVKRDHRIDERRITLWGFSMGGAGAWHVGLHHPGLWSSIGAGAGFVDTYNYQKIKGKLPPYQDKTLRIYDALDYALNAFNVPVVTYGGEQDAQLVASTSMAEKAQSLDVPVTVLIGKGVGHKFTPEAQRQFMAFHAEQTRAGRRPYPGLKEIRFITYTPKYNSCEWLTVEEMIDQYEPATVEARVDEETGVVRLFTENVAVLQIARDVAGEAEIDGSELPLNRAAEGLLPGVYYERVGDGWEVMAYDESREFQENVNRRKRRDLQGPIDDAFMQPFVAVRGTGQPWSVANHDWAEWTLSRFEREFDKWLRGRVPVVADAELVEEMIATKNLILFGDPGSNSVLAKVLETLPVAWTKDGIEVNGKKYDLETHGLSLVYPNPLNPRRYVVINSGHTFHEDAFKGSNAQLYPRLGDIAVQKFSRDTNGGYNEEVVWAALFDGNWQLRGE